MNGHESGGPPVDTGPMEGLRRFILIVVGLPVLLVVVYVAARYRWPTISSLGVGDAAQLATLCLLVVTIYYAKNEYDFKVRQERRNKSNEYISRWNDPGFNNLRAMAAYGYNMYLRADIEKYTSSELSSDREHAKSNIVSFLQLNWNRAEAREFRDKSESLFAIWGSMNFFEELGHCYVTGGLERDRVSQFFDNIVVDAFKSYEKFIDIMNDQSDEDSDSFPYFRDLYADMKRKLEGDAARARAARGERKRTRTS